MTDPQPRINDILVNYKGSISKTPTIVKLVDALSGAAVAYYPPRGRLPRDEVIRRVTGGEWVGSRYVDGLVLTARSDAEDGVLAVGAEGGSVFEYIDGHSYDTGVSVTLGAPEPPPVRLSGHEDTAAVTVTVSTTPVTPEAENNAR